jgi:very-short-patch-repair endonuclease
VSKDKREKTFLINRGWTLLRFWEKDINSDIRKCIDIVKEAINAK